MWQIWLAAHVGGDMGDLQFLQQKADAGNLIIATGTLAAGSTGTLVSYTPANATTFVLFRAMVDFTPNAGTMDSIVNLKNDTTTRETHRGRMATSGTNVDTVYATEGDVLIGNGAKKYELNASTNTQCTLYGTIVGYLE